MSADLYDIKVFVCKIWESVRNCFRNNIFSSLPPYNADQFARIQGTDDNYMKGYLIKRKYQLFLSQMLQLMMIIADIRMAATFISNSDDEDALTHKTIINLLLLKFSIVLVKIIEWCVLSVSLRVADHKKTLLYSHVILFSVFVVRLFYLYLPYQHMIESDNSRDVETNLKHYFDALDRYLEEYSTMLMFLLPNILLLQAAKKTTLYLSQYYDNATKDDFFYYVHFILTWIYVPFVSIFYGVAYFIMYYIIFLGGRDDLKEEYVPVLWMLWFLSTMLELIPRKTQWSCITEKLATACNFVWWVIAIVILARLDLFHKLVVNAIDGYAQYYQLKLQLRDFFVALEYRRRTDTRPRYGGERVVEMLHMDPPTMPMDIQSDGASPTAVHIPISAAGYQKVEEAS